MRKLFGILLLLIVVNISNAQNYNVEAYKIHQSIVEAQQNIGKEVYEFNASATDLNLKILKFEINRSIAFIDSLKINKDDSAYYQAAKQLFSLYKDLTEHEYSDLLKIVEDPDLEYKDFKAKKIKIYDAMKAKSAVVYPIFNAAQESYCKKYKLKIE